MIRSPEQVRPGDLLLTVVQHGEIVSRVEAPPSVGKGGATAS